MSRYRAGVATYRGDVRHIVGEVKGPTSFGSFVAASGAEYDAATDRTVVEFSTTLDDDRVVADEHRIVRLVSS